MGQGGVWGYGELESGYEGEYEGLRWVGDDDVRMWVGGEAGEV